MLDPIRNFNADFDAIFDEAVQAPKEEVRGSRSPLPADVLYYLNEVQRLALHSLAVGVYSSPFICTTSYCGKKF